MNSLIGTRSFRGRGDKLPDFLGLAAGFSACASVHTVCQEMGIVSKAFPWLSACRKACLNVSVHLFVIA